MLYGIINFWASTFPLPKACFDRLEQICNAFLWTGLPNSARGARVSWESVCTPKKEGGLGLRRIIDMNKVFGLKLIWLLFSANGSLWVAWIRKHLIKERLFWDTDFSRTGSWIWKGLMKLRDLARPYLICQVQSGNRALFWHDNWTSLGPLINITGSIGPLSTGISSMATVASVILDGSWNISQSRNRVITLVRDSLPSTVPNPESGDDDFYLLRNTIGQEPSVFSSSKTWTSLHPPSATVPWYKAVWFKEKIPKHAFLIWLAVRDRLLTRDRLRGWSLQVPNECVFCGTDFETKHHMFFSCTYSREVWLNLLRHIANPPLFFDDVIEWLLSGNFSGNLKIIIKLLFQASVYSLWKERNSRIHGGQSKSVNVLTREIQLLIRAKLAALDRVCTVQMQNPIPRQQASYLLTWFTHFQP